MPIPTFLRRAAAPALAVFLACAPAGAQPADTAVRLAKTEPADPAAAAPAAPARPPLQAAPRAGAQAEEAAHNARYGAAIKPVRDAAVSADDLKRVKAAVARLAAGDHAAADAERAAITDAAARKLVEWLRLNAGVGTPEEYRAFAAANPAWPIGGTFAQRHEEALFTAGGSAGAIKAHFKASPPRTAAGFAALASAHLADGETEAARRNAQISWREHNIAASLETGFLERFGKLLAAPDHKWRLDRLMLDDLRWTNDRVDRSATIRRTIPLLPEADRARANARLQVFLRNNAKSAMDAAATGAAGDWGFVFHKVQLLRRAEKIEDAAKLAASVPLLEQDKIVSPDGWWTERRVLAYAALRIGNAKLAYEVTRNAGPLGVEAAKDQAFLAGWIAWRHLGDIKSALPHFETFARIADGPLSRSKAHYWLGRAYETTGRKGEAVEQFKRAAPFLDTFHGQLARGRLGGDALVMALKPPAAPSTETVAAFQRLDAPRAAVIAHNAGLERATVRTLLGTLARHYKTEAEVAMVAHLAESLGDTQQAVRIGKSGVARGLNLIVYSYPLHAFPAYTPLRTPPESALLLGIARQESEFNTMTVSGAGARGILQVMPVTARHVCKDHKIKKCDINRLLTDAPYNTMMASAYIGDRMAEFQNSYVLGTAGYNAGPGRARQWIREFGDPRDPAVDPIDWIHRIPFEETREYVQKVLSNLQVYRARLAPKPITIALDGDLARARGAAAAAVRAAASGSADTP